MKTAYFWRRKRTDCCVSAWKKQSGLWFLVFMGHRCRDASGHFPEGDRILPVPLWPGRYMRMCMKTGRTCPASSLRIPGLLTDRKGLKPLRTGSCGSFPIWAPQCFMRTPFSRCARKGFPSISATPMRRRTRAHGLWKAPARNPDIPLPVLQGSGGSVLSI